MVDFKGELHVEPNCLAPDRLRALMKTSKRAREAGNHTRETQLLESYFAEGGAATDYACRAYVTALYKSGERRAAKLALAAIRQALEHRDDTTASFVERMDALISQKCEDFDIVIDRLGRA